MSRRSNNERAKQTAEIFRNNNKKRAGSYSGSSSDESVVEANKAKPDLVVSDEEFYESVFGKNKPEVPEIPEVPEVTIADYHDYNDGQNYSGGEMDYGDYGSEDDEDKDGPVKVKSQEHRLDKSAKFWFENKDLMRKWYLMSLKKGLLQSSATKPHVRRNCDGCDEPKSKTIRAFYLTRMSY